MSDELKPCKRCGGKAMLVINDSEHEYDWDWFVQCKACYERTDTYSSIDKAIAAWNTRDNDNMTAESVVSDKHMDANDVIMAQADSREKLEEDAFEFASYLLYANYDGVDDIAVNAEEKREIRELLDRQAVITERELCEYFHMLDRTDELEEQVASLTAELCRELKSREYAYNELNKMLALDGKRVKQINELEAERDQLDRDLTAEHALVTQFEHDNDVLRDKLREKQHVCDVQRDSFLKLEAENAKLRKELDECSR